MTQNVRVSPARGGNVRRTKGATDKGRPATGPPPSLQRKGARTSEAM